MEGRLKPAPRFSAPVPMTAQRQAALLAKPPEYLEPYGVELRTLNMLEEMGIFTLKNLLDTPEADLLAHTNFGERNLASLQEALEKLGF